MTETQFLQKLIFWRREIHKNPELGGQEFKTKKLIEKTLKEFGIPYKKISKTGILGILNYSKSANSPCIALRADMDALPLNEISQKNYASKNPGVMHACGHDAHVAMLLGACLKLSQTKDLKGTVKFLFQPNEEGAGGAKEMLDGLAMQNPKVNAIFGLHVNPRLASGKIGIKSGPLMAAVDQFEIKILGNGGHAAYPHEGNDALLIGAEVVQALQTIVSRKVDPVEPCVITVGTFQSGERYNILAQDAALTGTVRTLSEKLHGEIPKMILQIVKGICKAHKAKFKISYNSLGSVLSNHKGMTELAKNTAQELFGKQSIQELEKPSMGGEDFAEYLKNAPGCFIYLGVRKNESKTMIPWHHPQFDLDESSLPKGAYLLAGIAKKFLKIGEVK